MYMKAQLVSEICKSIYGPILIFPYLGLVSEVLGPLPPFIFKTSKKLISSFVISFSFTIFQI